MVYNREANICELVGNQHNFCNLGFYRVQVAEGGGEQAFKEVVLPDIIIALVVDSEKAPHIFCQLGIEDVVWQHTVKYGHNLQLGLLITSGPFEMGLSICEHQRRG